MTVEWRDVRVAEENAATAREPNLLRVIAARARRASDGALVGSAMAGLVALGGLLWMEGRGWGVLLPVLALGMWGGWGVCDRTLRERIALRAPGTRPSLGDSVLTATRASLAIAGVATGVAAMLALLGMLLGRIIS